MQPASPNKDFDFMLKNNQQAKRSLPMPNIPKPAKIGLAVVVAIFLIIIVSSFLSGRKNGNTALTVGVLARNEETLRVTTFVQKLPLQDSQTQALAATAYNALLSDNAQLTSYLARNKVKTSTAELAVDTDKSSDAALQTASQNNGLDAAYVSYLREALGKYQNDLVTAYKSAGPNGKKILSDAYESTKVLLATPPLKS
jgi:hypothetical protein